MPARPLDEVPGTQHPSPLGDHAARARLELVLVDAQVLRVECDAGPPAARPALHHRRRVGRVRLDDLVPQLAQPVRRARDRGTLVRVGTAGRHWTAQGHGDPHPPDGRQRPRLAATEHGQRERRIGRGPCNRAGSAQTAPVLGGATGQRDHALPRLHADQAAVGRRHPERAATVSAERESRHAGGDGDCAAPGRPAGVAADVPRVAGHAVGRRRGVGPRGEFRHRRDTDHDRARAAQPRDEFVVGPRRGRVGRGRAVPHLLAGHRDVVLDRDRDAGQRQPVEVRASVDLRGLGESRCVPGGAQRAEGAVVAVDAGQVRRDHVGCAGLAGAHSRRDLRCGLQFGLRRHG